ncbi:MAG: segregation and condensation protein A [Acidobacteriaceae bacterium]
MAEETNSRLHISLPRYDGPFDLLLAMVRRHEWLIDELPVAEITRQFLAYIRAAKEIDAELGGEFVEVASWLVLLQSRSLLPSIDSDGLTPREELRRAVLDAATLAAATEFLRGRGENPRHGSGGAPIGRRDPIFDQPAEDPTIADVLDATRKALEAARAASSLEDAVQQNVSVEYQIRWIVEALAAVPSRVAVSTVDWFDLQPSVAARAALFLALLELARKGILLLNQGDTFSRIRVKTTGQIPVADELSGLTADLVGARAD